jgi:xylulokinase
VLGGIVAAGAIIRWFRDNFGQMEKEFQNSTDIDAYRLLDLEAEKVPPGCDGLVVLPYFMGERTPIWDAYARGIIFGLTLHHTRSHIYRALLEAIGYALRHHIEVASSICLKFNRIIAVDGGAKSRLWRQIVTDIINMPQEYVSGSSGAPFGDAFLAGIGVKAFKDYKDIIKFVTIDEVTKPNSENNKLYSQLYPVYLRLYNATKEDAHYISKLLG